MSFVSKTRRAPRYGVPGGVIGPLGDAASIADQVSELQRQLGRFYRTTLNGKAFMTLSSRLPVTGQLDGTTALWAVLVMQQRNLSAYKDMPLDSGTQNLLAQSLAVAATPDAALAFVQKDIPGVLAIVSGYADYLGLSNEQDVVRAIVRKVGGTGNAALLAAGAGALLFLVLKKRKRGAR